MIPSNIKALILDMDGVIWKGDAPIGDLPATFKRIRERGLKFVFATNNGTKTPEDYQEKLAELGVDVEPGQVVTSALGIAFMLAQRHPRGMKIFVIGENGIRVALEEKGFEVVGVERATEAEAVVMGIDRGISFQKVAEATLLVRAGRPFIRPTLTAPSPLRAEKSPGLGPGFRW
ncbi:MAG: hypothetical protein IPJ47_07365 [Anaerolineales bacterium]|nr:hypothetical protein [Anaerolineales bacterium]